VRRVSIREGCGTRERAAMSNDDKYTPDSLTVHHHDEQPCGAVGPWVIGGVEEMKALRDDLNAAIAKAVGDGTNPYVVGFDAFLEARGVRLATHQRRFVSVFMDMAASHPDGIQFMFAGLGSGRTFVFALLEQFFDEKRREWQETSAYRAFARYDPDHE
jgi:hypothetical protein